MVKPRILFMGTPAFALPALRLLHEQHYPLVGVVCQPDRPKGRGLKEVAPPVKILARELGLKYPYIGNVGDHPYQNTYCPKCHALLIERSGYLSRVRGLDGHRCATCGEAIAYVSEIKCP